MERRAVLGGLLGMGILGSGGDAGAQAVPAEVPEDVKASLAPTGVLRAAINYGNASLASRDADGALSGVSVDIARELGRRLGLTVALVPFDAAGKVTAAASAGVWDVAFLARDPVRARDIAFTPAYVVIDGNYVVPRSSAIASPEDVDRPGVRVAVGARSAYDLFLSRTLKHAEIVRAGSTPEAVALFRSERLDVLAGVRRAVEGAVAADPGLRLIPTPFMAIRQAMGTPAGRPAAERALAAFVEDIKASGFVAQALERHGQGDAAVAPPG